MCCTCLESMDTLAKLSTAALDKLVGLLTKQVGIKQAIIQDNEHFNYNRHFEDPIEQWKQFAEEYDDVMTYICC